jgi:hypothetical protein
MMRKLVITIVFQIQVETDDPDTGRMFFWPEPGVAVLYPGFTHMELLFVVSRD